MIKLCQLERGDRQVINIVPSFDKQRPKWSKCPEEVFCPSRLITPEVAAAVTQDAAVRKAFEVLFYKRCPTELIILTLLDEPVALLI